MTVMGNLHIRRVRATDLEILVRELGQRPFFDDRMSRQDKERGMLLAAWRDARPVGVVYLWLEAADEEELGTHLPGTPILNHLEVHPAHRGRGIGTKLVEAVERRARKLGCASLALAVEVTNLRAAQLYERLGYVEWRHGELRCYGLADGASDELRVEICRVMVKALG
jgi:GNAT superfamily N-acetyltransferase